MFYGTSLFNKDVTVWNICKVGTGDFTSMFTDSGQPETDLVPDANGKCIECPNVCFISGSGLFVEGQNPCTPVPSLDNSSFRKALALWFSNQALATITYGSITDW